jgi:hypothetical protein
MANLQHLTTTQLKEALQFSEEIASLQEKLHAVLGGTTTKKKLGRPRKSTRSPESRAKMAAAQKARWAKVKKSH